MNPKGMSTVPPAVVVTFGQLMKTFGDMTVQVVDAADVSQRQQILTTRGRQNAGWKYFGNILPVFPT